MHPKYNWGPVTILVLFAPWPLSSLAYLMTCSKKKDFTWIFMDIEFLIIDKFNSAMCVECKYKTYLLITSQVTIPVCTPGVCFNSHLTHAYYKPKQLVYIKQVITSGMCPHWLVVVGPTTTQPLLTTTQATYAPLSELKRCLHATLMHFCTIYFS